MTDHDALLRAIVENPAEDTPRLMFADWLDENADAFSDPDGVRDRAAFIRYDIAMSQRDAFDPDRLRWELVDKPRREAEPAMIDSLPGLSAGCEFARWPLFRRGFPWAVVCEPRAVYRIPEIPLDAFPLESVRFRHCGPASVALLRSAPWAARLREVEFDRGNSPAIDARQFFPFVGLHALKRLAFLNNALTAVEVHWLVTSRMFRQLHSLTVTRTQIGNAVMESLLRDGGANGLRELHLVACRVQMGMLTELLDSPATAYLDSLTLGGDLIGSPDKFLAFARLTNPPPIRSLDVSDDSPRDAGMESLLASPLVPGLHFLDLSRCSLNRYRVGMLADGAFDNLRVLRLNANAVGNDGLVALARSPHLANLLVLEMRYSQVGDEGIAAVLESPLADGLVFLDLLSSAASAEMKEVLKARMGDRVRV